MKNIPKAGEVVMAYADIWTDNGRVQSVKIGDPIFIISCSNFYREDYRHVEVKMLVPNGSVIVKSFWWETFGSFIGEPCAISR